MHPALWKLLWLRYRANVRRTLSGVKTFRGAATFFCGLMVLLFMLGSNLVVLLAAPPAPQLQLLRMMAPAFLLVFTLLSLNSTAKLQAIHFWPAEVDFLFAGPFSRRELLLYKLTGNAVGAVFLALLFSTWITRYAASWWFVVIGLFLAICFVQLMQMALVLLVQTLSEHGVSLSRRVLLLSVGIVVAVAIWKGMAARQGDDVYDYVVAVRSTWAGWLLTAPFEVFGRVIAAEHLTGDFATWTMAAIGLNLVLLGIVIRMDANYLESSVAGSQVVYQRMQQVRSGNFKMTSADQPVRRRLPRFPRLGGAGTIARRQFTKAVRGSMWVPLIILSVGGGLLLFLINEMSDRDLMQILVAASVYCTFIFSSLFPYDFRGDLEQMELLKQLPVRPVAIAAGELAAPIVLVSLLQAVLLVAMSVVSGDVRVAVLAGVFVVPFNVLLFGIENLTFLLYPVRIAASTPGDFQHFGRQMLMMMAKLLLLSVIAGVAALGGGLAYLVSGQSTAAGMLAAWLLLTAGAVSTLPAIAWAFRRFDVSRAPAG